MARWSLDIVFGSSGQQGPVTAWGFSEKTASQPWAGKQYKIGSNPPSGDTPTFSTKNSDSFRLNLCDTDYSDKNVTELVNVIVAFVCKDATPDSPQSPFNQANITWFAPSDAKDQGVHLTTWNPPWPPSTPKEYQGGQWEIGARVDPDPDVYIFKNQGTFECLVFLTVKLSSGDKKVFWVDPEMDVEGGQNEDVD